MNLDHKNTHNKQEWMFNNYYNTSKNQHKVGEQRFGRRTTCLQEEVEIRAFKLHFS